MDRAQRESLLDCALAAGVHRAYVLPVSEVPFDAGLRAYCEADRCGCYGRNYACPPSVGSAEETIAKVKSYEFALVFQTVSPLQDSLDIEGMVDAAQKHNLISNALFHEVQAELPESMPLSIGACRICSVCAKTIDQPCRHPERAVSSLEAYCVNVSQLAEKCHMKYINGQNTITYFSALFFRTPAVTGK